MMDAPFGLCEERCWPRGVDRLVVVVAAGAGDPGDVGAVDVDGRRSRRGGVAHTVDVAGRREPARVADVMLVLADQIQVSVEQFIPLGSLDHAKHTPRRAIVDP
jgi:hypothetical protein